MMERCRWCGQEYPHIWQAPDILWKKVTHIHDGSGFLCMPCFDNLARDQGIALYWGCSVNQFPDRDYKIELKNVMDALAESVIDVSDEEILEEVREDGLQPETIAKQVHKTLLSSIKKI